MGSSSLTSRRSYKFSCRDERTGRSKAAEWCNIKVWLY
jgi:hypothetical protein